jgi:flagellar hook-associated protein 1 FlgK
VHEVNESNRILGEVHELNARIREFEVGGEEAMGLRDRRDQLLDQLSAKIPARITEDEDGFVRVHLGGRTLLDGTVRRELVARPQVVDGAVRHQIYVQGESDAFELEGGRLGALQALRDETLPGYITRLDDFAAGLIAEVNAIHGSGPGGQAFFTGTDAATIAVSSNLVDDPALVNTGTGNELALAMVALQDQPVTALGNQTFSEYFQSTVVRIGGDVTAAKFGFEARRASLDQVQTQREQIEAVSLDEEMANMIAAEHAYQAAARLLTTSSEMLETLISIV